MSNETNNENKQNTIIIEAPKQDKKGFWGTLKWILFGVIGGAISALLVYIGIKNKKADKITEDNDIQIDNIETGRKEISEEIQKIDEVIESTEKVIEKAQVTLDNKPESTKNQIAKNEDILNKYKK